MSNSHAQVLNVNGFEVSVFAVDSIICGLEGSRWKAGRFRSSRGFISFRRRIRGLRQRLKKNPARVRTRRRIVKLRKLNRVQSPVCRGWVVAITGGSIPVGLVPLDSVAGTGGTPVPGQPTVVATPMPTPTDSDDDSPVLVPTPTRAPSPVPGTDGVVYSLTERARYKLSLNHYYATAVDFNNNGSLDLLSIDFGKGVLFLQENGVNFPNSEITTFTFDPTTEVPQDVLVEDLNADGFVDIVFLWRQTRTSRFYVLEGPLNTFGKAPFWLDLAPRLLITPRLFKLESQDNFSFLAIDGSQAVRIDQVEADGIDFAVTSAASIEATNDAVAGDDGSIYTAVQGQRFLNVLLDAGGVIIPTRSIATSYEFNRLFRFDVNRDGIADIVGLANQFIVSLIERADGSYSAPRVSEIRAAVDSCATDVNGDGLLDFLSPNRSGLSVLTSQGDGTFVFKSVLRVGQVESCNVVNLDNNNVPDLLLGVEGELVMYSGGRSVVSR